MTSAEELVSRYYDGGKPISYEVLCEERIRTIGVDAQKLAKVEPSAHKRKVLHRLARQSFAILRGEQNILAPATEIELDLHIQLLSMLERTVAAMAQDLQDLNMWVAAKSPYRKELAKIKRNIINAVANLNHVIDVCEKHITQLKKEQKQ